jgi:DNA-binding NarL/FixJ family response regulator
MKLLIVEDSDAMRELLRELLDDLAESIRECEDGAGALAAYRWGHPDWVLMDIRMKEVDGITATQQIKAAFPEARVVIVTEYDDAGLRKAAHNAGAAGYVLKEDLAEVREILLGPRRD